jgi:hypothetical protein
VPDVWLDRMERGQRNHGLLLLSGGEMNIPVAVVWEIVLVIIGFVFGTLWGHHDKIGKRVTFNDCAEKQRNCPCVKEIENIKRGLGK